MPIYVSSYINDPSQNSLGQGSSFAAYPTHTSNVNLFSTAWVATSANLSSTSYSTFTVPSGIYQISVILWGGGANNANTGTAAKGGVTRVIMNVEPGWIYKVIVPSKAVGSSDGNGGNAYSYGGSGLGGGAAQDSNDAGPSGAGAGFFYMSDGTNTVSDGDGYTLFSRGFLCAGGGATGRSGAGAGNGGTVEDVVVYGVEGKGVSGGTGYYNNHYGYGGSSQGGGGGWYYTEDSGYMCKGADFGIGGFGLGDVYGNGYGGGSGGGAGAGGCGGGSNNIANGRGEDATGTGGRGYDGYSGNFNGATGPGAGGDYNSTGGNGIRYNGVNLGGGGGGSHGAANGGGGFGGGSGNYYSANGGGGSGCAFGNFPKPLANSVFLGTWISSDSLSVNGGNANSVGGVSVNAGNSSSVNQDGYDGAVIVYR